MDQKSNPHRPALPLLLAAAALPLTPALAQETQTQAQTPPVTITPPAAPAAPSVTTTPPVVTTPAGGAPTVPGPSIAPETEAQAGATPPARTRAAPRTSNRAATRSPATARATAPEPRAIAAETAPAPEAAAPAPVAETPAAAPVAQAPAPAAAAPAAPAETAPAETAPPAQDRIGLADMWPLLLAGALAVGGLVMLLLRRRRRRAEEETYEQSYHEPVYEEPMAPAYHDPAVPAAPAMAAPMAHDHVEPVAHEPAAPMTHANDTFPAAPAKGFGMAAAGAGMATAAKGTGRPWIELLMRPVRAGVGDDKAVVEFELSVDNHGSAPAEDVRVSTWMLAGGSSEAERMLIDGTAEPSLANATIDAGEARQIEGAVDLPRAGLHDSVLPVVVAEARYRLPDGSEGRTAASFAVGVPVGEELAHFDVENPSGLHEHVVARLHGQPEKV